MKHRAGPGEIEGMNVVGEIEGKHCIIVDDMIDTAGTLCKSAETLMEMGAKSVSVRTEGTSCKYCAWQDAYGRHALWDRRTREAVEDEGHEFSSETDSISESGISSCRDCHAKSMLFPLRNVSSSCGAPSSALYFVRALNLLGVRNALVVDIQVYYSHPILSVPRMV